MASSSGQGFQGTPRFELRRQVGSGAMGVVYEAFDHETNEKVALKTLKHVDPRSLARFKAEFRTLQDLEHRNLCRLGELIEHDGALFFTMELVDGVNLLQYVRSTDAPLGEADNDSDGDFGGASTLPAPGASSPLFDEGKLRATLGQLASALAALHEVGKIHRDVKPSNILVAGDGRVVLLDFGMVRDIDVELSSLHQDLVGTAAYMAPEQALSGDVGAAADWYSFGALTYEAITGRRTHSGTAALDLMLKKQQYEPPPPRALNPHVPRDLDTLCVDLLQIDPRSRPDARGVFERLGVESSAPAPGRLGASAVRTDAAPFVGRSSELAELRAAYEQTREGQARAIVLEGMSGFGKSALLRHFLAEVESEGAVVFAGRCYERESVPYQAFDGVIDALSRYLRRLSDRDASFLVPRNAALLLRAFPVLGRVRALAAAPKPALAIYEPQELRNRSFAALRELLFRLAEGRPIVVAIDDWHWADRDSGHLLQDLLAPPDAPAILLALSSRPVAGEEPDPRSIIQAGFQHLEIGALALADAIELARLLLSTSAPDGRANPIQIVAESSGHPLYIAELVRHIAAHGADTDWAVRLDEAIRTRVSELSRRARDILEVTAVAGEPLAQAVIRDAAKCEPREFARQLGILRVSHLVKSGGRRQANSIEPYHDRVRETVAAQLDQAATVVWHRRIALALDTSGAGAERSELLLRHLEAAGLGDRAADLAAGAAERSAEAAAFDRAAELYRTALRLGSFAPDRTRALTIRLGEALANAGRGPAAAAAFLAIPEGADPATHLACHRQAAEQLLISGHVEQGLEVLRQLLAEIGVPMPASQRRALLSLLWHRLKLRLRGLRWEEKRESQIAPETLVRLDVYKAASHGLAMVDNIRGADFNARWLLLALRTGERSRCAIALATEGVYLASQGGGGVDRGRALVRQAHQLGEESDDRRLTAWAYATGGAVEYWAGHLSAAEHNLRRAETVLLGETTGTAWELKNARLFLTFTLRNRGAWAELRTLLATYIRDAKRRGDRYLQTSLNRYCSPLLLASDDPVGARQMVDEDPWISPAGAFHAQHWYELESKGEIALYERPGDDPLAELGPLLYGLKRSVLLRVQSIRVQSMWLRGRLELCRADLGQQPRAHLAAAARLTRRLERESGRQAPVMAGLLASGLAAARGDLDTSVARLREVAELADAHEISLLATVARRRLGQLLGGDEGTGMLIAAEAKLAAEGVVAHERFSRQMMPGFDVEP